MKSKLDIYNILSKEGQMYLPPFNECSMSFIKDILNGKKKVSTLLQLTSSLDMLLTQSLLSRYSGTARYK